MEDWLWMGWLVAAFFLTGFPGILIRASFRGIATLSERRLVPNVGEA